MKYYNKVSNRDSNIEVSITTGYDTMGEVPKWYWWTMSTILLGIILVALCR